jgi:hypothetical protein
LSSHLMLHTKHYAHEKAGSTLTFESKKTSLWSGG